MENNEIITFYANSAELISSVGDLEIKFIDKSGMESVPEKSIIVKTNIPHARALLCALSEQLKKHDKVMEQLRSEYRETNAGE